MSIPLSIARALANRRFSQSLSAVIQRTRQRCIESVLKVTWTKQKGRRLAGRAVRRELGRADRRRSKACVADSDADGLCTSEHRFFGVECIGTGKTGKKFARKAIGFSTVTVREPRPEGRRSWVAADRKALQCPVSAKRQPRRGSVERSTHPIGCTSGKCRARSDSRSGSSGP